jgi:hypothetical protein
MRGENDGILVDPNDASFNDPKRYAEVGSTLSVAFLLLLDILFDAQRGNLRLHLVLELGAASVAVVTAAYSWTRYARRAVRADGRARRRPPASGDAIDSGLWSAIASAIRAEAVSVSTLTSRDPIRLESPLCDSPAPASLVPPGIDAA